MKATSIYGGVRVVQILIEIIKAKVIAVFLGTTGMGISSLLTSTTGFISSITNFGLGTSGVKNIAEANGSGNYQRISITITVLRKCVWFTGLLGLIVCLVFSQKLSIITFGNKKYTIAFIWLSLTFVINQLSTGQLVVLQGLSKIRELANANLTGAILGLVVSLPLYYFWKVDGIVPAIIGTSMINLFRSWYFTKKLKIKSVPIKREILFSEGKSMLKMGFIISLSGLITTGSNYATKILISNLGDINQTGLYNAGFTLLNAYVGLIFSSMATDYFPRLSSHSGDNNFCQKTINEQAEIMLLLLAPLLVFFILFSDLIIRILYTNDFLSIVTMINCAVVGMLFRAVSWAISFVFVAKGHAKIFFWNELLANIYFFLFNFVGYLLYGLTGIGFAFLLSYIIYLFQMCIVSFKLYGIKINFETIKVFIMQLIFVSVTLLLCVFLIRKIQLIIGVPFLLLSSLYSVYKLNQKLNIILGIRNLFKN